MPGSFPERGIGVTCSWFTSLERERGREVGARMWGGSKIFGVRQSKMKRREGRALEEGAGSLLSTEEAVLELKN